MKLFEISQLPFYERFKFVNDLISSNIEVAPDVILVKEIFDETIDWYQKTSNLSDPNVIYKLQDPKTELPKYFESIYEIKEKFKIEKLPNSQRQRIFDESKEVWQFQFPDFKRISDIMIKFNSDDMLLEFMRHSPPSFIRDKAAEVYKKCISYRVKLKNHKIDNLGYSYTPGPYCISCEKVKLFTNEYGAWGRKAAYLWNEIYSLSDKYNSLYAYNEWLFDIKHPTVLKERADNIQKLQIDALALLNEGKEMILKHDKEITLEYNSNSIEMSYYERELEILQMIEAAGANDEEYCFVYTLECELFVFYVGIAANPRERFEQHIRGSFSDEAHLFKSKFIQKYHNEVKQKIIFEGTRRECRKVEKDYIAEHNPLGNMTDGGEG